MRTSRIYIIFLVFLTLNIIFAQAKIRAGDRILKLPQKYLLPVVKDDLQMDLKPTSETVSYRWIVYSDRDNNKTFTTPGGKREQKVISFLEEFFVADEQGLYLRIIRDPGIRSFTMSEQAEDFGWINKENLLLWQRTLVAPNGSVAHKGMILNTIAHLTERGNDDKPNIVEFKKGPKANAGKSGQQSNLFQFFFIYKSSGNSVLLGRDIRIPRSTRDKRQVMVGWAPKSRMTLWNNRVALEPNWEKAAVAERKKGPNLKAKFFQSDTVSRRYKNREVVLSNEIFWDNDPLKTERFIGEMRRLPVLDISKSDPDIVAAGVMGVIQDNNSIKVTDPEIYAELQRKLSKMIVNQRRINVVFVVDGTSSVEPFFGPISEALVDVTKMLKQTRNEFNFAAVIYRDYPEKEHVVEVRGFSSDESISSFFNRNKAMDRFDTDLPEAMYNGIENAIRGTGLGTNNTNIIILVGDAGNHKDDPRGKTKEQIADLLEQYNCHLMALQVHHKAGQDTYNDFISQLKFISKHAANKQKDKIGRELGIPMDNITWSVNVKAPKFKLNNSPYGGWIIGLKDGKTLPLARLKSEIITFIENVDKNVENLITKVKEVIEGKSYIGNAWSSNSNSIYSLPLAPGLMGFLRKVGVTPEELTILQTDKYQLYVTGSTTMRIRGQHHPLFKRVLLLDLFDLARLLDSMAKLLDATTGLQIRQKLHTTWFQILKEYLGGSVSEEELNNLTLEQINNKVMGLPGVTSFLAQVRLRDIVDEAIFTEEMVEKYKRRIEFSEGQLRKIFNAENYKYAFFSNDTKYYWIEEDILP